LLLIRVNWIGYRYPSFYRMAMEDHVTLAKCDKGCMANALSPDLTALSASRICLLQNSKTYFIRLSYFL
jgi:hypothetical protein